MDTEFIENGKTIDLMSLGMVREDGKTYYAVSSECDLTKASPWVAKNVIPFLFEGKEAFDKMHIIKSRKQIKKDILEFAGDSPEFWAYYADYDWVTFCQIFGTMMDLPDNFPKYCMDFMQTLYTHNIKKDDLKFKKNVTEHNALADAIELKDMYNAFVERFMRYGSTYYKFTSDYKRS